MMIAIFVILTLVFIGFICFIALVGCDGRLPQRHQRRAEVNEEDDNGDHRFRDFFRENKTKIISLIIAVVILIILVVGIILGLKWLTDNVINVKTAYEPVITETANESKETEESAATLDTEIKEKSSSSDWFYGLAKTTALIAVIVLLCFNIGFSIYYGIKHEKKKMIRSIIFALILAVFIPFILIIF